MNMNDDSDSDSDHHNALNPPNVNLTVARPTTADVSPNLTANANEIESVNQSSSHNITIPPTVISRPMATTLQRNENVVISSAASSFQSTPLVQKPVVTLFPNQQTEQQIMHQRSASIPIDTSTNRGAPVSMPTMTMSNATNSATTATKLNYPKPQSAPNPKTSSQYDPSLMISIEPTPLRDIQQQAAAALQHPPPMQPTMTSSYHVTTALPLASSGPSAAVLPGATAPSSSSSLTPATDHKSRKEQFLMFTRVLMKYLDKQDPNMHAYAKQVIRECAQKNRNGDPGYTSLSISMQKRLKQLVGESYWHKATEYLARYFKEQYVKSNRYTEEQARIKAQEHARLAASDLTMEMYSNTTSGGVINSMNVSSGNGVGAKSTTSNMIRSKPVPSSSMQRKGPGSKGGTNVTRVAPPPILTNVAKSSTTPSNILATPSSSVAEKKRKTPTSRKATTPSNSNTASMMGNTNAPIASSSAASAYISASNKEYNILLEMVHHVVDYDVKACALIFSRDDSKMGHHLTVLTEEQRKLLYDDFELKVEEDIDNDKIGVSNNRNDGKLFIKGLYSGRENKINIPSFMKGWGVRNILSVRAAWAKLRLEEEINHKEEEEAWSLPGSTMIDKGHTDEWFDEEQAENDETLALISEATQYYIRTILQGALHAATQRMNLDGMRIWHSQHKAMEQSLSQELLPFSLRLGCDVQRQMAMCQGNAAKTCQRMEEALLRNGITKDLDYNTLTTSSSMMELSKIPTISSAVSRAELYAKRSFDIYGGKFTGEPPFGTVPKKAKIHVNDLNVCLSSHAFAVHLKGTTRYHLK